jgi:insulysin
MNKIQYFDIETSINDKRNIKGFELDNKIKVIFVSDPDINFSSCSIAVGAGYLDDEYQGTAHFLEHLLFMGSEKYPEQNEYHSYIQINGGQDNAFTSDTMTCYYLALETSFLKKGIEMLSWFFRAPLLNEKHIGSEMEIIDSEHNKNILSDSWIMDDIFKNFIKLNSKYRKFGTGNLKSLNNIKKKDIIDFYDKYYTTDNLFVCVVDSKNINQMINEYLPYFQAIPIKLIKNNSNN